MKRVDRFRPDITINIFWALGWASLWAGRKLPNSFLHVVGLGFVIVAGAGFIWLLGYWAYTMWDTRDLRAIRRKYGRRK